MKSNRILVALFFGLLMQFIQTHAQETTNKPPKAFSEAGEFKFQLYPIGWSENESYFAYIIHNIDTGEASPPEGYYFAAHIQDVRTDKKVYSKQVSGYDFCGDNEDCDFSFNTLWRTYDKKITSELKLYNIEIENPLNWNKLPLVINNNFYTLKIENMTKRENTWGSQKVTIATQKLGNKTIFKETYKKSYQKPIESNISGAFISPSKTRLFILKRDIYSGFEGEKYANLTFIGSHLKKGFQANNATKNELNNLVLSENSLGDFPLKKGMPLSLRDLKKNFKNFSIKKSIGEQDGPDFFIFSLDKNIWLYTPDTKNESLREITIAKKSPYKDEYGVQIGMTYDEVVALRGPVEIATTWHYHTYLYQEDSRIMYKMSLGSYNHVDKYKYSAEEAKKYKFKVTRIVWR